MTTGERIKLRRKELFISAETLAEKIGVSPATIYRYEKGDIEKVPITILNPLADALHTTPGYLMGWEDAENETHSEKLNPKKQQLIDLLSQVPDEKADLLIHIVQSVLEDARK